ncbi:MAG: metallophosphoesterase family protein [Bacillota bacterium]
MNLKQEIIVKFKRFFKRIRGQVYIPEELKETEETILLHISDTPENIFSYILTLIDELSPDIIVHTGDLVDNYKLGLGLSQKRYEKKVTKLIQGLENCNSNKIYLVPGNHDSREILENQVEKIIIKDEGSIINIEGQKIGISHFMERLPLETRINLYGHNKKSGEQEDIIYLNGILNINIILFPSLKTFFIPYPGGTGMGRQYRSLKLP